MKDAGEGATVSLVFRGELLEGHARDQVMRQVGIALQVEGERLAQLFSGAPVVLRRGLAAPDAERHAMRLARLGAHVHIETDEAPSNAARAAPASAVAPTKGVHVPTAPAPEQVTCPNCGEVQPQRILCRACATDIPMALAARSEADAQARAQRRAEFRARRGLAPAEADSAAGDGASIWGLGWHGRLGRMACLGATLWLLALLVALAAWTVGHLGGAVLAMAGLVLLVVLWFSLRLTVLRLHDCNLSGWWCPLFMVPWLGQALGVLLMAWPGTRGANRHGAPPPRSGALAAGLGGAALGLSLFFGAGVLFNQARQGLPRLPAEARDVAAPAADGNPLRDVQARAAFQRDYLPAGQHKAFAVSAGGAWGWVAGSNSPEIAMWDATVNCEAHRKPDTPRCAPVNVNGTWIDAPPR